MAGSSLYGRAVVLGLLIAVGAFAIDMYIPGFAAITADLKTDPGTVQLSMTSFFVALAFGQILYGTVSDSVGRRRPIFFGLGVFMVGSIAAACAPNIHMLIAARFLQGLGAAATAVIPMAVIRDQHTGPDAARLLSLALLSLSISPILAPVFGGFLVQYTSWRLIFVVLILITLAVGWMVWALLPETLPVTARVAIRPLQIVATYGRLLGNRSFMAPILIAAFAQAVLFIFISASPFVFVTLLKLKPTVYGIVFALHAIAVIGVSQLTAPLMRRMPVRLLIGGASIVLCLLAIALFEVVTRIAHPPVWAVAAPTISIFACLGLIMAPAFLTAMEPMGAIAGTAAALGACLEFSCSSIATALMSLAADGTARPMAAGMVITGLGVFGSWVWFLKKPPRLPAVS